MIPIEEVIPERNIDLSMLNLIQSSLLILKNYNNITSYHKDNN